jgi:hypothetical protein
MNGVEYFPQLPGWTRGLGGGSLQQISNKNSTAELLGIGDEYECLVYGPESSHSAGEEALYPEINILTAEDYADDAGKCLMYAPSVGDYEEHIPLARGIEKEDLVPLVAPHVDMWGFQLGNRQGFVDRGFISVEEFRGWLEPWIDLIRSNNPDIQIIAQMGIGKHDPATDACLPPPSEEYYLQWRELVADLIDGIVIMPPQPCQPCPENPPPGFPCSNDPQDNVYYAQYFQVIVDATNSICSVE